GAAAKVLACQQDLRVPVWSLVEHERRVGLALRWVLPGMAGVQVTPGIEQVGPEAAAPDRLHELFGQYGVRVHIAAFKRCSQRVQGRESIHQRAPSVSPTLAMLALQSVKCPATAAAAAITGLTRCVRPPAPWRPSKFRLEVEAQRSPGANRSSFMPRHIEQPGSRHSKPASTNTLSSPSASACALTRPEP